MGKGWRGGIVAVEITVHAHATEDVSRVRLAVENLLPPEVRGKVKFEEQLLEGHHGNPITRMKIRLQGEDAERFILHVASMLSDTEKKVLASLFESRYDRKAGRLYLRFSKQDAYLGEARLYDGDDVIHVVVIFRGSPSPKEAMDTLRKLGLIP
jgi:RNA binding exosome subunit